ncbi:hypothetical protein U8V72_11090 [Priestia filamentosa]|uniref:hypothetical protein n=1 Tax=Priestia filamentosa TaxID=1402861 RepID=UPI0039798C03
MFYNKITNINSEKGDKMHVTATLKDNYKNLSELNQQTIFYMGKLIKEKGTTKFQNGETRRFIEKVSKELNAANSTVQRLYYRYINKHTYEELAELGDYYRTDNKLVINEPTITFNKGKNKMVLFKTKMIPVYEEGENYYFELDELLKALPISKSNKALKNSLAVKGRKILEINNQSKQCIEVEKVKAFLQSFLRQLTEGEQKDSIRMFLESLHQLSLKSNDIFAKPVVEELKPIPQKKKEDLLGENKVMSLKQVKPKNNKLTVETVKSKVETSTVSKKETGLFSPQATKNMEYSKPEVTTKEINIDETEEIKALTKILNNNIGYLSQEAKEKLYNLTQSNGLVNTVVATMGMLEDVKKDTSMYFVNKIEEQLKVCL